MNWIISNLLSKAVTAAPQTWHRRQFKMRQTQSVRMMWASLNASTKYLCDWNKNGGQWVVVHCVCRDVPLFLFIRVRKIYVKNNFQKGTWTKRRNNTKIQFWWNQSAHWIHRYSSNRRFSFSAHSFCAGSIHRHRSSSDCFFFPLYCRACECKKKISRHRKLRISRQNPIRTLSPFKCIFSKLISRSFDHFDIRLRIHFHTILFFSVVVVHIFAVAVPHWTIQMQSCWRYHFIWGKIYWIVQLNAKCNNNNNTYATHIYIYISKQCNKTIQWKLISSSLMLNRV